MTDALSTTFAALADPTRRAILMRLASTGEASVSELAEPFAISVRAVSKHLRVLEDAGLVSSGKDAQRRPRTIEAAPLQGAAAWLDQYRIFWESSFDRLEEYARVVHSTPGAQKQNEKERKNGRKK